MGFCFFITSCFTITIVPTYCNFYVVRLFQRRCLFGINIKIRIFEKWCDSDLNLCSQSDECMKNSRVDIYRTFALYTETIKSLNWAGKAIGEKIRTEKYIYLQRSWLIKDIINIEMSLFIHFYLLLENWTNVPFNSAYELWFKQILWELDSVRVIFQNGHVSRIELFYLNSSLDSDSYKIQIRCLKFGYSEHL